MPLVKSSTLRSLDWEDSTLTVEFLSGAVYVYKGVQKDIYDQIMNTESKGKAFDAFIKKAMPSYDFRRIK